MSDQIGSASIGLAVDSSGVDAGLNTMEATVTRAARSLSTLGRQGAAAVDGIGSSTSNAASSVERATQRQARSIQTLTAELQSGGRATREFQETMARNRGGEAAVQQLRPYLDELDRVRAAQQATAEAALRGGAAFNTQSQSAAQLAANLRVVPAQLTDIVTSLQGGQAPLTVFLQQGGQLRDMFGSAGGAARALGGYLVSLVSPLTVAAAAVALLGVAYNQGSKEADAYRKSIILTGNVAGVTTSQLSDMAKQASETAGTQGQNADALAQLVGTGKVAADQLTKSSVAAVQAQKYLGIAVEDTVKNFADLGKDPLQATLKLNEQYNYLTLSTYKQIKALELQEQTAAAAKVAQTAYADTLSERSKKLEGSLGTLEKAWGSTGNAAKGAWDFMLNIGREDTIDDQIASAQKKLDKAKKAYLSFIGTTAEKDADRDDAQRQLDRLKNIKKVGDLTAQYAAEDAKSRDAAIKFDGQEEQYLSRRAKMKREITAARSLGQQSAQRGEDPATTEERIQKRIAQIRASYADLNNQGIEGQIAGLDRLGAKQDEIARRALITLQGNQDAGLNGALDKQFAYIDAIAAADEASLVRQKARLQARLELTSKESVSEDNQFAKQQKLADLRAEIDLKDEQITTRRKQRDTDIFVADKKNNDAIAASYNALIDARVADTTALATQLQSQQDQNAAIVLSGKALEQFNTQLVEERASRLEVQASILANKDGRQAEAEELIKQAQLMRDLNQAQIEGARKTSAITANKQFWDSVDRAAQNAFTTIFEGGKSAFDRLKDTLKAGLLDLLYQLTVKKWIIQIGTSITGQSLAANVGSFLTSGTANATGTTLANGSSALSTGASLANIGKSVYDAVSNGFAGLTASIGAGLGSFGNLIGSSSLSGFGTGVASTGYSAAGQAYLAENVPGAAAGLSTAPLITAAAGIAAGVLGGNLISGGYSAFGGSGHSAVNAGTAIGATAGSIVPLIGTAVGALVGGLVGGATNRLFGYKAPQIESQGIQGTINASGVTGDTYANILQKGGLFRSDKRSTTTAAIDSTSDAAFDKTVLAMITAVKGFGTAIGEQTTSIDNYTKDFKLELTGDATKDADLITKLFSGVGDELAITLIPSIAKLSNEGETASAALQRLATDYVAVNSALGAVGLNFGAVGAASLESREKLIALTGGLDKFVSQAEFFSQNFLSDAERTAAVQKQLNTAFTDLGVTAIPKTRDEFKALVQGLDLTSAGGQNLYAGLMGLEDAFASITPQIDAAAVLQQQRSLDIQLMEALGNEEGSLAATRADALKALLTDQARITQAQVYAAQDAKKVFDALTNVADTSLSRLTTSINAEKDRINAAYTKQADAIKAATDASVKSAKDSLQAAQDQQAAIQTVFNALDSALSSTQVQSDEALLARRQAAQSVLAQAQATGNLANNKALTDALSTLTGQGNERLFGTFEEYARDQARTNNAIAALKDSAGTQADNATLTVKKLGDTVDAIQAAADKQLAQLQADNEAQLAALDEQLATSNQQLDALKGIDSSVLSVKDALTLVAASLNALKSNPTGQQNTATTYASQVKDLYQILLNRTADAPGVDFWVNALKAGATVDQVRDQILKSQEYQTLHPAASATTQSIDTDQISALMAKVSDPAQNSSALLAEVQRLNDLTTAQQVTLNAIAASTGIAGDVLDRAQKGQPLATEAV